MNLKPTLPTLNGIKSFLWEAMVILGLIAAGFVCAGTAIAVVVAVLNLLRKVCF